MHFPLQMKIRLHKTFRNSAEIKHLASESVLLTLLANRQLLNP